METKELDQRIGAPTQTKRFWERPGTHIVDIFKRHLAETGDPTSWIYHTHSKPPPNNLYVELDKFEIPDKFRSDVGLAKCPICSPKTPKYYSGRLAWFPDEGVIRAIGAECAETYFSNHVNRAEEARIRHENAIEFAENYLQENLPKVPEILETIIALRQVAQHLDKLRAQFWLYGLKQSCIALSKRAAEGHLEIFETFREEAVGIDGRPKSIISRRPLKKVSVEGCGFLSSSKSIAGIVDNAHYAFSRLPLAGSEDEAFEIVIEYSVGENGKHLIQLRKLVENTFSEFEKISQVFEMAARFLSEQNLNNLDMWVNDPKSEPPFGFNYIREQPARVYVSKAKGLPGKTVTVNRNLLSRAEELLKE